MSELRMSKHSETGASIVEIWEDGRLIGVIYPKDRGIKLVSKYFEGHRRNMIAVDWARPPALHVDIWDGQLIDEPADYELAEEAREATG